jgi:hypothetical protein
MSADTSGIRGTAYSTPSHRCGVRQVAAALPTNSRRKAALSPVRNPRATGGGSRPGAATAHSHPLELRDVRRQYGGRENQYKKDFM